MWKIIIVALSFSFLNRAKGVDIGGNDSTITERAQSLADSQGQPPTYSDHHSAQVYLVKYLINESRYSKFVRPVIDEDQTTKVRLGFQLGTVIDLDEASQTLTAHVGLSMTWTDEYLRWNRADYYNVTHLRMSSDDVWMPDVTLSNSAGAIRIMESTIVSVRNDGRVNWSGLIILKTFCKIDFSIFPYDEQKCNLTFRPWTHVHSHVKMGNGEQPERLGDEDNGEWTVELIESIPTMESHDHGNYSKIAVVVHLRRRPLFYFMNMIIPCVLIYGLTLLSFCLPGESGEKIALNVTILLSLTVFMLLSAEMMPPSSDSIPIIAQFYTATIVLVSISIALAVMSLNFFHRPPDSPRAPNWLRKLFLKYLTPVLFPVRKLCDKSGDGADLRRIMDCNGDVVGPIRVTTYHSHQAPPSPKLPAAATRRLASHHESCADEDMSKVYSTTAADGAAVMVTCATCNGAIRRHLDTITEDLHSMIEDKQEDDEKAAVDNEWKQIAHAFDRFCLLLFIVATIILAIILKNELNKGKTD